MLGTYVLSAGYYDAYYLKAQQVRTLIRRDYEQAFERLDVIAMPTSPTPAFRIGERVADPLQMYLADVFTVSANLAGLPAISVPVRLHAGRAADRPAADGPDVRRNDASGRGRTHTNGRHRMVDRASRRCNAAAGRRCRTSSCSTSGCATSICASRAPNSQHRIAQVDAELAGARAGPPALLDFG